MILFFKKLFQPTSLKIIAAITLLLFALFIDFFLSYVLVRGNAVPYIILSNVIKTFSTFYLSFSFSYFIYLKAKRYQFILAVMSFLIFWLILSGLFGGILFMNPFSNCGIYDKEGILHSNNCSCMGIRTRVLYHDVHPDSSLQNAGDYSRCWGLQYTNYLTRTPLQPQIENEGIDFTIGTSKFDFAHCELVNLPQRRRLGLR